ncbi:uncharacterized protein CDAR_426991 [Caerostris darwini]|uniref:Uncharacterized protein n=1 Tax=Caerostris darwini TaxID=1538125 RepID=A0AAV4R5N6_9ARAC|nr:uncharacterized protein CDAR_426991 [Caerostris darwini]
MLTIVHLLHNDRKQARQNGRRTDSTPGRIGYQMSYIPYNHDYEDPSGLFGPNLKLPSIGDMKSGYEKELNLLKNEIDAAFERKHKDLIKELSELRILRQAKKDEIENLKSVLATRAQNNKRSLDEHTKYLVNELAKLKEENAYLKKENNDLQKKLQDSKETDNQLESLKRNLGIQQEENSMLKDRLADVTRQHSILQENYQKLLNVMTSEKKTDSNENKTNVEGNTSNFLNVLIAEETEKYIREESEHCEILQSKINREIQELKRTLQDGAI